MATSTRIKGVVFQLINQLTCRSLINSVEEHVYADQGLVLVIRQNQVLPVFTNNK